MLQHGETGEKIKNKNTGVRRWEKVGVEKYTKFKILLLLHRWY